MAITKTWNTTFNNSPSGSANLADGDDRIRETRVAVDERQQREHYWGNGDTNSNHGLHKEGSAVAYYASTAPTKRPDGVDSLTSLDEGRLFYNSSTGILYVYSGSAWVGVLKAYVRCSVQYTLSIGTNVLPPIILPRACTVTKVSVRVGTAPTGASLIIDLNKNGSNSIFDGVTRPTITAGSNDDSVTSFHATYSDLAADDYLTLDIDQVGSSTSGSNLSVSIEVGLG